MAEKIEELLALAKQYASECANCGGKGQIVTRSGGSGWGSGGPDVCEEIENCEDCAHIWAVINKARNPVMTTGTEPRCDGCRQLLSELQPGHVCTTGSLTPRVLDLMVPDWYVDMSQPGLPHFTWGTLEKKS